MDYKKIYQDYLIETLNRQCRFTKEHIDQCRAVFANNRNVAGFNKALKELTFTLGIKKASGSHFTDVDGNDYLDMTMGFGVHLFGHKPAFIEDAIKKQIENGITLGPLYEDAGAVAQLIHELTGNERCAFYNSGTEAVMVAMRIARAATAKNKVVIFEGSYHGTHDSLLGVKFDEHSRIVHSTVPGVTQSAVNETMILEYGNEQTFTFLRKASHEIAAVLIEPVMSRHPEITNEDFLRKLSIICIELNIALIFDEVITGFRVGNSGVAGLLKLRPDITTYGKIAGGGIPIGIVAGKNRFMSMIDGGKWQFGDNSEPQSPITFTAGTFNHHPLAMAAAKSVLQLLKDGQGAIQDKLNNTTEKMCEELNNYYEREGYALSMVHFSSLFRFLLKGNLRLIFYALLKENIYIWEGRNCFLSTAHSPQDIDYFKEKVKQCCFELEAANILHRKKTSSSAYKSFSIVAGIQVKKLLEKDKLAFACRYLFTTIPALRKYNCSITDQAPPAMNNADNPASFIVNISNNKDSTFIKLSVDRNICDGWSMILFFKLLSRTYNAMVRFQPLPQIDVEDETALPGYTNSMPERPVLKSKSISGSLPIEKLSAGAVKQIFPFLLSRFQKTLAQEKDYQDLRSDTILVPVAGQLYYRKLKAFGQFTLYKEISCGKIKNTGLKDELNFIDHQVKSHHNYFSGKENNHPSADIIFNMDNLNFQLNFDGEKASLMPVEETQTLYPLVCNVSKSDSEIQISLKYAVDKITPTQAKNLLASYIYCLKQKMYENF